MTRAKLDRLQSYYDYVKNSIKQASFSDTVIINFRRGKLLNEREMNADLGKTLKKIKYEKLDKYNEIRKKQTSVNIDLTKKENKRYINPFDSPGKNEGSKKTEEPPKQKREVKTNAGILRSSYNSFDDGDGDDDDDEEEFFRSSDHKSKDFLITSKL